GLRAFVWATLFVDNNAWQVPLRWRGAHRAGWSFLNAVIPAQAGIHCVLGASCLCLGDIVRQ
ncbi:MAG: hypothetical protein IJY77_02885, partial [Alphaproteobacteria bacterium]|nr:hypothetical protein [Alphaproteobacteria bacterium]